VPAEEAGGALTVWLFVAGGVAVVGLAGLLVRRYRRTAAS